MKLLLWPSYCGLSSIFDSRLLEFDSLSVCIAPFICMHGFSQDWVRTYISLPDLYILSFSLFFFYTTFHQWVKKKTWDRVDCNLVLCGFILFQSFYCLSLFWHRFVITLLLLSQIHSSFVQGKWKFEKVTCVARMMWFQSGHCQRGIETLRFQSLFHQFIGTKWMASSGLQG